MAVKFLQFAFFVCVIAIVCAQDFNPIIWNALCTRTLVSEPGTDKYPLSIVVYPDPLAVTYTPNQRVRVTLRANDSTFNFAAFVIQAHPPFDPSVKVGRWEAGALGQPISCSHPEFIGNDAAAQSDVTSRSVQELIWIAPENPGNYVFNLTTSQEFGVYWVDQLSYLLRVV